MPFYDYTCKKCDTLWTKRVSVDERDTMMECPKCGVSDSIRKLFYPNPVKFNGSGFYETDFKNRK